MTTEQAYATKAWKLIGLGIALMGSGYCVVVAMPSPIVAIVAGAAVIVGLGLSFAALFTWRKHEKAIICQMSNRMDINGKAI